MGIEGQLVGMTFWVGSMVTAQTEDGQFQSLRLDQWSSLIAHQSFKNNAFKYTSSEN